MLDILFTVLLFLALVSALLSGSEEAAGRALLEGGAAAVRFCLDITGSLCLWSALSELMTRSGWSGRLARMLRPLLRRLFPLSAQDPHIEAALSENLSANLLGLGNAATPAGIRAARGMAALGDKGREEMAMLVVLNTASLQILPGTIAALRANAGAAAPFDVMPAVWLSSLISVFTGLAAAFLFKKRWPCSH